MRARQRSDADRPGDGRQHLLDLVGDDQPDTERLEIALERLLAQPVADARGGGGAEIRRNQRFLNLVESRRIEARGAEIGEIAEQPVRRAPETAEQLVVPRGHGSISTGVPVSAGPSAPVMRTGMMRPIRSGAAGLASRTSAKPGAWPRSPGRSINTGWTDPARLRSHAARRAADASRSAAARSLRSAGATCGIRAAGVPSRGE